MNTTLLGAITASALVTSVLAQGALNAPCFVTPLGINLGLTDDSVSPGNALGFSFPMPGGGTVSAIDISSNGFIWLGSNSNNGCCNGYLPDFLASTPPRIAPAWMDLNPSGSGGVWFNTFPATATSPASAVVTWDGVPEYANNVPMTIQLQLFDDGSFCFAYDPTCSNVFHDLLIGVTQGNNATSNPVDFLTINGANPHISGANPTIEEVQTSTFDVAGKCYTFVPLGVGGYIVLDRPHCIFATSTPYGVGCPKPATAYEFFSVPNLIDLSNTAIEFVPTASGYVGVPATGFFTGYTNSSTFFDDQVLGPFNLPFTFNYGAGSTTAIDIASNGFIWLQSGNSNSRCCDADPAWFVSDPASICALWMDLYPPGGGNIYFDVVGGTEAHITWLNVPEYFNGSPQTAQITLRSDGSFRLAWQNVVNSQHNLLVGFTAGATADPGSSDFSVGPVLIGSGGNPLRLAAQPGSKPQIGSTFTMELDSTAPGSVLGLMVLGVTQFLPGIDLSVIGMDGCELYASLDVLLSFPLVGPPAPFSMVIPANPSLAGAQLFAQGATLTPAINPFNIASSNGLALTVGN